MRRWLVLCLQFGTTPPPVMLLQDAVDLARWRLAGGVPTPAQWGVPEAVARQAEASLLGAV